MIQLLKKEHFISNIVSKSHLCRAFYFRHQNQNSFLSFVSWIIPKNGIFWASRSSNSDEHGPNLLADCLGLPRLGCFSDSGHRQRNAADTHHCVGRSRGMRAARLIVPMNIARGLNSWGPARPKDPGSNSTHHSRVWCHVHLPSTALVWTSLAGCVLLKSSVQD